MNAPPLRSFLALSGSALLLVSQSQAANYYWDSDGTTAGLGDTAGTWGTSAFVVTISAPMSRSIIGGKVNGANTATTTGDFIYFGTANLGLGSTASDIPVGTLSIGNIAFGAGQANAVTLIGGTLTLAAAGGVTVNNASNTINSILAGAATSFTKGGAGTLTLTGANTYIGTTIVRGGGVLNIGAGTTGSLNGTTGTALTFDNGGGTFNLAQADTSSQGMGALTFSAGDGTVTSTAASGSATQILTFDSLAVRSLSATGNFSLATNTTAASNKIVLTTTTNAPLDSGSNNAGYYFGGTEYARYDTTNGYFRAVIHGTDTNAPAPLSGTDFGAVTSATDVKLNGNITAQTTAAVNTIHLDGNTLTLLDASQVLDVNGILSNGGAIAAAGALQGTTGGGEIVFNVTGGDLAAASTIQDSRLTKTGPGTLTLSGANTYAGSTNINSGTLAVSGGSAIADAGAVVIADAAGATLRLDSSETISDVTGGGFTGGTVNVQGNTLTLAKASGDYAFGGRFTGTSAGGIIKQGSGKLTLSNKNSFAGTFTLEGGAVEFTYGNDGTGTLIPLSSGGAFSMANGTTLRFNAVQNLPAGVIGAQLQAANGGSPAYPYGWTFANDINIASGTSTANIRVGGNENCVRFTGGITGGTSGTQTLAIFEGGIATGAGDRQPNVFAGTIADGSGGTLGVNVDFAGASGTAQNAFVSLSGQNTFTGPIVVTNSRGLTGVAAGGGYLGIGGEIHSGGPTFVTGSGYLGGGNYTNTISLAVGTKLTYLSSANQILGGEISGGGALLKRGIGTLTLSEDNIYTGSTTVSTGALIINGSTSTTSLVTVASGATLGGIGTVGGNTTLNGILSPGTSPGTLTFTGDLTVEVGSTYLFDGGDLTAVSGNLDLNDNWTLSLGSGFQDGGTVTLFTYGTLAASPALSPNIILANLGFTPSSTLTVTDNGSGSIILNGISISAGGDPYEIWATGNEDFNADANLDGVDDGLAWFLTAATPSANAADKVPVPANDGSFLTLDFDRVNPYAPAKLYVQFGNDLTGWTEVEIPATTGTINLPGDDVEVVVTGPGAPTPDAVKVKIPVSYESASGTLFARLRATEN